MSIDLGPKIGNKVINSGRCCPNCSSCAYIETVSKEYCSACGYEVDYWGKGCNSVALAKSEKDYLAWEREQWEEDLNQRFEEERY